MANTHFSGPVLYSGKGQITGSWGTDLPIAVNLDVFQLFDDFTNVALDATNAWTVVKDSGASAGIGADIVGGVLDLTSAATTDDDDEETPDPLLLVCQHIDELVEQNEDDEEDG